MLQRSFDIFVSAVGSIRSYAMRSLLTTLGIVIGVAAIVAVVGLVQGLAQSINSQFEGLGANTISISSYTSFRDQLEGRVAKITHSNLEVLQRKLEGISDVTPIVSAISGGVGRASWRNVHANTTIFGTTRSYEDVFQSFPVTGRFMNRSDDLRRRRVCVIGEDVRTDLELPADPTGEYLKIMGQWFKIIGVMEARGDLFGLPQDDYILIPYSAARNLVGAAQDPDIRISLTVDDGTQLEYAKSRIEHELRRARGLSSGDSDDFRVETAQQLTDSIGQIATVATASLSGVVGISLLVGGIGIMNIMLVSVTERTREIGISKALGATRTDVLIQFLIEAVILCLLGGAVGILLGYGVSAGIASFVPNFPGLFVPLWAIVLALGFSTAVGIVFGIVPAIKAANLDPIEALRYE